ncbi:MAG: hypothetical protein AB7P01_19335 [Bacteroidia bacterium]
METISEHVILIIISVVAIGALIGWLVWRNIKDKEDFEETMNDPKRIVEKHPEEKM